MLEVVERSENGRGLPDEDIEPPYGLDPASRISHVVRQAARQMSLAATDGKAEIHAQIGLNGSPCGKNCKFCSFAASNGLRKGLVEISLDDLRRCCDIYSEQGVNLILVLTTASYPFEKLFEMVDIARAELDPSIPLLVNTGDMSLSQTRQLKSLGVDGAYHAVRMREGIGTAIPVKRRL